MSRTRKFRPAAECLETRLALNGNMAPYPPAHYTPAETLGNLTNEANDLYTQANQDVQSYNTLATSTADAMKQYDTDHVSTRLNLIGSNLEQAQELIAQEHSLAAQVQQLAAQERALKAEHPHLKDRLFRTVVADMNTLDASVTQVSNPWLNQTDAWLNSNLK